MNSILKKSVGVFGRTVFANVICCFVCITISALCTYLFTSDIGYTAYGTLASDSSTVTSSSASREKLYEYRYSDGEDTKKAEYEAKGYTVETVKVRSDMKGGGQAAFLVIDQLASFVVLIMFIYGEIWHLGTTDNNKVHFGHIKEDKLKGLKIGLLSIIPAYLFNIVLIVFASGAYPKFALLIYKFMNCSLFGFVQAAIGNAVYAYELTPLNFVLLFAVHLVIPLLCAVAYILGYKEISLREKMIYKKKETNK